MINQRRWAPSSVACRASIVMEPSTRPETEAVQKPSRRASYRAKELREFARHLRFEDCSKPPVAVPCSKATYTPAA